MGLKNVVVKENHRVELEIEVDAAAFDAACVGKTADEIANLMTKDGKSTDELQKAGCTIYVTGFVKAATKI